MKLKIFEAFSGIGAQHKAITRLNKKLGKNAFEIVATCDWDIKANISYDAIHKAKYDVPNILFEKKFNFLSKYIWSWNGKDSINNDQLIKKPKEIINNLYKAVKGHKNLGNITQINGQIILQEIPNGIDIITYSFPCQNLSTAGAFHKVNTGMKKGSGSRSGLLWEIARILLDLKEENKLPKYLLLENVKSMLFKRHQKDFNKWIKFLKKLGYDTKIKTFDARDFGIPQRRQRAFCLSILNYKVNELKFDSLKTPLVSLNKFIKENPKYIDEYNNAIPNDTPSRRKIRLKNPQLIESKCEYVRTITTKQDRHPNAGTIKYKNNFKNKSQYRFLTPRETFKLMGFDAKDFNKAKKVTKQTAALYKQAGNSVVVTILEFVFKKIYEIEKEKQNGTNK